MGETDIQASRCRSRWQMIRHAWSIVRPREVTLSCYKSSWTGWPQGECESETASHISREVRGASDDPRSNAPLLKEVVQVVDPSLANQTKEVTIGPEAYSKGEGENWFRKPCQNNLNRGSH